MSKLKNNSSADFAPMAIKVFIWGLLFLTLYILRAFFLLIFLTFVFAYLQARLGDRLSLVIKTRVLRVIIVLMIFLVVIGSIFSFILPRFIDEAKLFVYNYPVYLSQVDKELIKLSDSYPTIAVWVKHDEQINEALPWSIETSTTAGLIRGFLGLGDTAAGEENLKSTLQAITHVGRSALAVISSFLLALLFSFLIVLDLPRLKRQVQSLSKTRVAFIYNEVAEGIYQFGKVVGRALEAQFFVAVLNTFLTALGLWLMGLTSKITFLTLVVFLFSFIPVAGVFISSVPICLVALQTAGITYLLLAIVMITVVHLVETYILNPRVYGGRLHMNPVLVLIVLTIGGKLFGVWGLVLGLPATRYIFGEAIQKRPIKEIDS